MHNWPQLEQLIGYTFTNQKLLKTALTHKSYHKTNNNQRLEFLGDAVLSLVVATWLYQGEQTADVGAGVMTNMRSRLVCGQTAWLNYPTAQILADHLLLSNADKENAVNKTRQRARRCI